VEPEVLGALSRPVRAHGPVGVAPLTVSERAWDAVDDGRAKAAGWYLNLRIWREFGEMWRSWHPHPTTMPTSVLEGLERAVESVLRPVSNSSRRGRRRRRAGSATGCASWTSRC
jgi:aspartate aminotransferase-like enzyme